MAVDDLHPLKAILQNYVASDLQCSEYIQQITFMLTKEALSPSPHLVKWTTRLGTLLQSRDTSARWFGLCLALKTAQLSKSIMLECAQGWISLALPLLSHDEPLPTLKAAIRLVTYVLSATLEVLEFQRQVAGPNMLRFVLSLLHLAKATESPDKKVISLQSLSRIISLYPTLTRPQYPALSSFCLDLLFGSTAATNNKIVIESVADLYASLHITGGKAGAPALWRKSLEEVVALASIAVNGLRSTTVTAPFSGHNVPLSLPPTCTCLSQLGSAITLIKSLLQCNPTRAVPVPVGSLSNLCVALLSCTPTGLREAALDPVRRTEEIAAVPEILSLGCGLLRALLQNLGTVVNPYCGQHLHYLCYHLEEDSLCPTIRETLVSTAAAVLALGPSTHSTQGLTRIVKVVLPELVKLTSKPQQYSTLNSVTGSANGQSRKAKKRTRAYEADEVFKTPNAHLINGTQEGEVLLSSLEVLMLALQSPELSPAMQSLTVRVLLSTHLSLGQMTPTIVGEDASLHARLVDRIRAVCASISAGSTGTMSKSLGLLLQTGTQDTQSVAAQLDLLLHPRLPPLMRPLPHVENLALFAQEEGKGEAEARAELKAGVVDTPHIPDYGSSAIIIRQPVEPATGHVPHLPPIDGSSAMVSSAPIAPQSSVMTNSNTDVEKAVIEHGWAPPVPSSTAPPAIATSVQGPASSLSSTTLSPAPIPLDMLYEKDVQMNNAEPPAFAGSLLKSAPRLTMEEDEEIPAIDMDSDSDNEST